jgi:N-acetylneuraminic acid mutarotase
VAVSDGSYVYLIGGRPVGTVGSDLWRYDPISDSWTSLTPMPTARATEHMAVHHGGRIFVIGGRTGDTPDALGVLDTLEVYKIAEDTWVTKTPMPEARSDAAVVKHGNKIYVFGGYDETGIATDTTFIYRIAKDTWTEGEPMPEPRANPVKGKCGNKIHIIGGYDLTGTPTTTHFVYNPVKDRWSDWSDSDPALSETAEVQGISHGGRIYVVGGGITETDTPNDINQVFKCAP